MPAIEQHAVSSIFSPPRPRTITRAWPIYRAACSFFAWLEQHGIGGLVDIEPFHVAAYIKALKVPDAGNPAVKDCAAARPTVKQQQSPGARPSDCSCPCASV